MQPGVFATGETALIVVNDAFAIGAYNNVPGEVYLAMLQSRWNQLTTTELA